MESSSKSENTEKEEHHGNPTDFVITKTTNSIIINSSSDKENRVNMQRSGGQETVYEPKLSGAEEEEKQKINYE